jgi:hypothetical protein
VGAAASGPAGEEGSNDRRKTTEVEDDQPKYLSVVDKEKAAFIFS